MNFIYEVIGDHFFVKLFLVPTILGGIFISKNIIHGNSLIKNRYAAFFLYSSNFTAWILLLKLLFLEIDQGFPHGYLLSDISLIFIAIVVDYFIVSYYENIEYAVIPSFIIFYACYVYSYGFHLKSTLLVGASFALFWFILYVISKNQVAMMQSYTNVILISLGMVVSVQLLSLSLFPFSVGYSIGVACKTFIILIVSKFIFSVISSIVEEYSQYKKFTYIDTLTNVYNRRKFEETMNEIIESPIISKFSLVFFDVDSFKRINDSYGHNSGDYILKEICYITEKYLREEEENGQLFRYGGDEFFLIFRNRSGEEVRDIMSNIVKQISAFKFYNEPYHINVSISVGVAEIKNGVTQEQAIYAVDKNLYTAKTRGKNQVYYN